MMNILFEEHAGPQRAGGIESATQGLIASLAREGVVVTRSFTDAGPVTGIVPDCVHIHGIWSPTLARRFLGWRRRGIPSVVTLHGMLEPWAVAHKALKKQLAWNLYQKRLLNMASALHATSEREAGNLRTLGLTPRIEMIPWGVEMPEVTGQRQEDDCSGVSATVADFPIGTECQGDETARSAPIHDPRSTIHDPLRTALFVGRIFPVKGLPLLVEAWAKVRPAGWKLMIVGPDEAGHRGELEAMVAQAQLGDAIEFTGGLSGDALQKVYREADLFILPSYTENFGMVIGEAMSHGLPVITTHGAPWQLLEAERCGWWVPVSVEGIAAALEDATRRSPEELAAMGERGRAVVAERFAWERIAGEFLECYRWILGGGPKPGCVRG